MNLEKLKSDFPDLVQTIRNEALIEGAAKERARIQAIEEIAMKGHEALVMSAKFDGVTTAENLAMQMIKAEKARAATMLADRAEDAKVLEDTHDHGNVGNTKEKDDSQQTLLNHLADVCKYQGGIQ